jgi:hypothetical protein
MIGRVAVAAMALWTVGALTLGAAASSNADAQSVQVVGPAEDTLPTLTPALTIVSSAFTPAQQPVALRLVVAADAQFTTPLVDTTLTGDTAVVMLQRPLPDGGTVFWRATATGTDGTSVTSAAVGPRFVRPWLALLDPNVPTGVTLTNRRPTFIWSSAPVDSPPGPWTYAFELLGSSNPFPVFTATGLVDTTFTPGFDLDLNTSYRWRVSARLASGDSTRVSSAASFVIVDPGRPVATLLYQNFPNPFPRGATTSTCVWFDLRDPATVRLEIFDIRANLVRRLVPSPTVAAVLPAGRYGRAVDSGTGGCDPRFAWDGTADDGRLVAPGVYMLRLTANGRTLTKKILFRGR